MLITLAHIGTKAGSAAGARAGFDLEVQAYLDRSFPLARCQADGFRSEEAMLEWLNKQSGRLPATLVIFDSKGKQMSSEAFAAWIGARRDEGAQHLVFAIGPASGWSEKTRAHAAGRGMVLSLGPMTLAHSLARLVVAEQIYRASTILSGHPYHTGH